MIRRGINAYVAELPGFYVVNPTTNIAVSGWPTREEAERDAAAREARYPEDPMPLAVVRLPSLEAVTDAREYGPGGSRDIDGRWHDD